MFADIGGASVRPRCWPGKWVHVMWSVDARSHPTSPRHPDFTSHVLAPLAQRHFAGEQAHALSIELFARVHPWATSFAASQSRGLPGHADRSEVVSQVLRLTWEACLRIDWARYDTWPAFLDSKVSHARTEAARCDDWVSRRERGRRRRYQAEIARLEQQEQRTLTGNERIDVAGMVAPNSRRTDWTQSLLQARHPSTVADVPDPVRATSDDSITTEDLVEESELGHIRTRCLRRWLAIVAAENERLADDLSRWADLDDSPQGDLPSRLAHRVEPYTRLLLAMLGDAA
jgi:hypothetical protein